MDHNGAITGNQYLEYISCDRRSESVIVTNFINESNERCLEFLCDVLKTSKAASLLGFSTDEDASSLLRDR